MDGRIKFGIGGILTGLSIALGPATAGYFLAQAIIKHKLVDRVVTVKGLSEKIVKADFGTWTIDFRNSSNDLTALQEKFHRDRTIIINFLKQQGFQDHEIEVTPPYVQDVLKSRENKDSEQPPSERFTIESSVNVKTENVDQLSKSTESIDQLIRAGVILSTEKYNSMPLYYIKRLDDIRPIMISEATKSAKQMAEQFAKDSETRIGGIHSAQQGVFTIKSPYNQEGYDRNEDRSLMKKVRVVSTFVFHLGD